MERACRRGRGEVNWASNRIQVGASQSLQDGLRVVEVCGPLENVYGYLANRTVHQRLYPLLVGPRLEVVGQ